MRGDRPFSQLALALILAMPIAALAIARPGMTAPSLDMAEAQASPTVAPSVPATPAPQPQVDALLKQGKLQFRRAEFKQAIALYQTLLADPTIDRDAQIEALTRLGEIESWIGQMQSAEKHFVEALALAREVKNRGRESEILALLSAIDRERGAYPNAWKLANAALTMSQQVGNRQAESRSRLMQGILFYRQERSAKALNSFQLALSIAQAGNDQDQIATIYTWMALAYGKLQDFKQAEALSQQQQVLSKNIGTRLAEYNGLSAIVLLNQWQNQHGKAQENRQKQLEIAQTASNTWFQVDILAKKGIDYAEQNQLAQGLASLQKSLELARTIDNAVVASVHNRMGVAYYRAKQYSQSLRAYQQALDLYQAIPDQAALAQVWLNIGDAEKQKIQYPQAVEAYQQALKIYEQLGYHSGQAKALRALGWVNGSMGKYSAAIEFHQQALALFKELDDLNGQARALEGLGWANYSLDKYPVAIAFHEQALTIFKELGDLKGQADALRDLSAVYSILSNFPKALELYNQVLTIYKDLSDLKGQARTLWYLGGVYGSLNQHAPAISAYQQALTLFKELGDQRGKADALIQLGNQYSRLKNDLLIIESYQQALTVYKEINDLRGQASSLWYLGLANYSLGQYSQAIQFYQQALDIRMQMGLRSEQASTLMALGDVNNSLKKYSEAILFYQRALVIYQDLGDRTAQSTALSSLGRTFAYQNTPELAIVFYKQSVNIQETIRQNLRTLPRESQDSYTQSVTDTYRALADLLLKQDRILEAQEVLELLKIQEFDDTFKEARGQRQPVTFRKAELELLKQFNAQKQGVILAAQELITLQNKPEAQLTKQDRDRINELNQLQAKLADDFVKFIGSTDVKALVEKLRRKDTGTIDPETLEELRNKFSNQLVRLPNTALFYPLILDDRLELILITANANPIRRTATIDRPTLNQAIADFRLALKNPNQDAKPSAQKLYDLLIQPIADDLEKANIKTLLYSPDRRLRYVPLGALHDGKQWLIERLQISYITAASITDLTTPRQPQPKVLAGAISDQLSQRYTVTVPPIHREFSGLPNVLPEITSIATLLPNTRKLFAQDFTTDAIQTLARQYNILHFATHGSFERQDPELSFILFGGQSRDGKNYATLRDIATWKLDTDLVVLSACETGLADDQFDTKADDSVAVMGLAYKFEQAGTRATIASLWVVNDASTALIMQQFYKNLAIGNMTKAEALRQAQLAIISGKGRDGGNRGNFRIEPPSNSTPPSITRNLSHPYYWAPFILIGNGL